MNRLLPSLGRDDSPMAGACGLSHDPRRLGRGDRTCTRLGSPRRQFQLAAPIRNDRRKDPPEGRRDLASRRPSTASQ
jgi:hypothetical protein